MARLVICGSCVTRDAFEVRAHEHELPGYFARSSLVSQIAPPIEFTEESLGEAGSKGWLRRSLTSDFGKNLIEQIEEIAPDGVIIDLIDERLPLMEIDGTLVTLSPYQTATPRLEPFVKDGRRIVVTDPWRDAEFRRAAKIVMHRLTEIVPPERILLHRAPYSLKTNSRKQKFKLEEKIASRRMNSILDAWYDVIAEESGCAQFSPKRRLRVADVGHKWGLSPFHYVDAYYQALLAEVDRVFG
jgi:hypothetical protein